LLAQILHYLPEMSDPNLLVGVETSDDAAVYKLNAETAIIQTLDFFTPVVDDPYTFGQIAAANALSDIYAMGGKPLFALNIVCFPADLPVSILGEIIKGGAEKVKEAGALVVGGHSVDDNEPKYGLSVTGLVHPDKVLKNHGARPGDRLILTKPLGTGIINTAIKAGLASEEAYREAVATMTTLNKNAAEALGSYAINACTDITGFGLIGHAYEMASASAVTFRIDQGSVPYLRPAKDYAEMGLIPGGAYSNKKYLAGKYATTNVPLWLEDIVFDPQTSGGLLVSTPAANAEEIVAALEKRGVRAAVIGSAEPFAGCHIVIE